MEFSLSRYFLLDAREKVVDMNYGLRKLSRTYYHRKQNGSVVRKVRGRRKSGEREEKKVTVERRPPEELGCCGRILEPFRSCIYLYRKPLGINLLCLSFLFFYSVFGGFVFLHFEEPYSWHLKQLEFGEKLQCVRGLMRTSKPPTVEPQARRKMEEDQEDQNISVKETAKFMGTSEDLFLKEAVQDELALEIAKKIADQCMSEQRNDERMEWNLKNAVLFGFGILTTLGYGKIEPQTTNGRLFTVIYGFIGVPFTVIIFTNFGRYLQNFERYIRLNYYRKLKRYFCCRKRDSIRKTSHILPPITIIQGDSEFDIEELRTEEERQKQRILNADEDEQSESSEDEDQISPMTLVCIVLFYLLLGAALMSHLNDRIDFFNGIYFAFLCLTAIEYGKLIPENGYYLPIVIIYICFGLAISTIALDIGSTYVKRLYYLGRKIKNIADVRVWFGAKNLRIRELLAALGQNIGLEPTVLCELDLEQLISSAIQVKEGRLQRIPQTHMIMDGIWPPELVPLFLKDGVFPEWVDEDRRKYSCLSCNMRYGIRPPSFRSKKRTSGQYDRRQSHNPSASHDLSVVSLSQPPEFSPPLPPLLPEKLSVRFHDYVVSNDEGQSRSVSMSSVGRTLSPHRNSLLPPPSPSSTGGSDADVSWTMASTPAIPSRAFFPQRKAYEHHELRPAKRSVTVPEISVSSPLYIATFPSLEISSEFRKPPEPVTLLPSSDSGSEKTTTADRFSVRSVPSFENDK